MPIALLFGLVAALFSVARVEGFDDGYRCREVAWPTVGYDVTSARVEASSTTKPKRPATLSITGVTQDTTELQGNVGTTPLTKVSQTDRTIWFIEETPGATIVMWTLFKKDHRRPATLITTKSYSLGGAVNFTSFYQCE